EAGRLAAQLLAFSKQRKSPLRPVDLNQAVERTWQLLRGSWPETIQVDMDLSGAPALVLADEGQLQQVIMNLCLNARDAMPRGGSLTLQTAIEDRESTAEVVSPSGSSSRLESQSAIHDSWARLTVRDTGEGMDRTIQAR